MIFSLYNYLQTKQATIEQQRLEIDEVTAGILRFVPKSVVDDYSCVLPERPWYVPQVFQLDRQQECNEQTLQSLHDLAATVQTSAWIVLGHLIVVVPAIVAFVWMTFGANRVKKECSATPEENEEVSDEAEKKEVSDEAEKKEVSDEAEKKEVSDEAEKKEVSDKAEEKEVSSPQEDNTRASSPATQEGSCQVDASDAEKKHVSASPKKNKKVSDKSEKEQKECSAAPKKNKKVSDKSEKEQKECSAVPKKPKKVSDKSEKEQKEYSAAPKENEKVPDESETKKVCIFQEDSKKDSSPERARVIDWVSDMT
ncbi:DNA ligase 1-like [Penaeus chinensis]|uniref:DNA ligase 1-like n=1 Tax=Penaeus chinensis TaxID=139456 RepID=UPI001FB84DC4|nr:DNA ligase 1-like [Penaeus chinensis]